MSSWLHSLGHIPAKVWIARLAAQGSLCGFRAHHGVTEGHRHPQASLGFCHRGHRGVSCQTTPSPGLAHVDKRECSPTYKVDRASWRTLQKKRLGQHWRGLGASAPGTVRRWDGPSGHERTHPAGVCSPRGLCRQEALESHEGTAKTSACSKPLVSFKGSPPPAPDFNGHRASRYLPAGQVALWGREVPGGRGEQ